jgi:Flp pilus assembly protein protease CpaA
VSVPLLGVGFLATLARFAVGRDLTVVPYWGGILLLFELRAMGGGDAKLLLGLFGLWPDLRLFWMQIFVHLVVGGILLALKYRRTSWRRLAAGVQSRLLTRQFLPTADELAQGERVTFAIVAALAIYLVW